MYGYILTICWDGASSLLNDQRCPVCKVQEQFIVAGRENDAEKKTLFSQGTGILKGSH